MANLNILLEFRVFFLNLPVLFYAIKPSIFVCAALPSVSKLFSKSMRNYNEYTQRARVSIIALWLHFKREHNMKHRNRSRGGEANELHEEN